ncbi:2-C-methyl-D-erythritol 2,4-cyclodiphosphate synthase [Porphyromonas cangingivalis]|uniref:2-C-methyl-D-erythritol 2,4-cyclodiphosphate synthase n=1 Tax=Porphyromonas cangingivalis TaxID=36874 RepID=A0A1T4JY37_PORCN|nr:2-C-methyl-D-erythritol 2,4-cyclodiphosphate synthase [Porphyromonas cangingivalis]SJZ35091.1 2-C-methyl-D-erythritol 2,4-cyclodiphosphate synthase [Porphyromonas cangingivalis]VEJ03217.1 2-C-methyl-D-erythritol 2,4-cyclodiphosphate synthase [Porphyromonas cangingivalis]
MKCNIRVGFGYDVHVFAEGRALIIGGIEIPHKRGLLGHSDADVLLHSISDALLGAANLRDIGFHFPDTDSKYKGADSKLLLRGVCELLKDKGYAVGNVDSTIVAEHPKMNPHIPQMQSVIADLLGISIEDVSIKATTNEKMGFAGREEGIIAYATVLIYKE